MDKLQYDSLYKFLVSLGTILIALPIAAFIFLANQSTLIISKIEYEALSEYSINNLTQREHILSLIVKFLPVLSIVFFVSGFFLIIIGLIKWHIIQKILDSQVAAEAKIKELEAAKMSDSEMITEKVREVVEPTESAEPTSTEPVLTSPSLYDRLIKYAQIEDKFFKYGIPLSMQRRYVYKRNLRINDYSYDAIAISTQTNTDLIYEIKYWSNIPPHMILRQTLERLHQAGLNYKDTEQRNYQGILVVICPKEISEKVINRIESFLEKYPEYRFDEIEIKCRTEESLEQTQ